MSQEESRALPVVLSYKDIASLKEKLRLLAKNQDCPPEGLKIKIIGDPYSHRKTYLTSVGNGPFKTYKELPNS